MGPFPKNTKSHWFSENVFICVPCCRTIIAPKSQGQGLGLGRAGGCMYFEPTVSFAAPLSQHVSLSFIGTQSITRPATRSSGFGPETPLNGKLLSYLQATPSNIFCLSSSQNLFSKRDEELSHEDKSNLIQKRSPIYVFWGTGGVVVLALYRRPVLLVLVFQKLSLSTTWFYSILVSNIGQWFPF